MDDMYGLARLSTPVAYITTPIIKDPFKPDWAESSNFRMNRTQYAYYDFTEMHINNMRKIFAKCGPGHIIFYISLIILHIGFHLWV